MLYLFLLIEAFITVNLTSLTFTYDWPWHLSSVIYFYWKRCFFLLLVIYLSVWVAPSRYEILKRNYLLNRKAAAIQFS